jgi:DNA-binding Lrp family transcriptional regulator
MSELTDRGKVGIDVFFLPGEVAFNPNLTASDKQVFWIISLFDSTNKHCFASNEYFSKKLDISESQVTKSIAKLKEGGYILQIGFDGRKRTLAIDRDFSKRHRHHVYKFNDDVSFAKIEETPDTNPEEFLKEEDSIVKTYEADSTKLATLSDTDESEKSATQSRRNLLPYKEETIKKEVTSVTSDFFNKLKKCQSQNSDKISEESPKETSEPDDQILSVWNSFAKSISGITEHKSVLSRVTLFLKKDRKYVAISDILKSARVHFSDDAIIQAIRNYFFVLNSDEYFYSFKIDNIGKLLYNPRVIEKFSDINNLEEYKKDDRYQKDKAPEDVYKKLRQSVDLIYYSYDPKKILDKEKNTYMGLFLSDCKEMNIYDSVWYSEGAFQRNTLTADEMIWVEAIIIALIYRKEEKDLELLQRFIVQHNKYKEALRKELSERRRADDKFYGWS